MSRQMELKHCIRTLLARTAGMAAGALLPGLALAGPDGEVVVAGAVSVDRPDLNTTVVTQGTQSAIVNWNQFNVGGQELVQFVQPSSSAVILNRVVGNDPTSIFGNITANGHVFLVNTRGVYFSPTAQLDVQGLFASTLDIGDDDFTAGNYAFARAGEAPDAGVVNEGALVARDGGYVVLAGDWAENTGVIAANAGNVVLAAGSRLTLDLAGDGLVNFAVDEATLAGLAGARNSGTLSATGGTVVMTARVANALTATVVNNSGTIEARSIEERGGEVWLVGSGGAVEHSGTIDVAGHAGAAGGLAVVYGTGDVTLAAGGVIDAHGAIGGDVRAIAEDRLTFASGAAIDAHGSAGDGGLVEVSGHGSLVLRGATTVGDGGTVIIDPATLNIRNDNMTPGTLSGTSVGVDYIEGQLNAGADVKLVANITITTNPVVGSVTDITATSAGAGDLFIEIGNTGGALCNFGVCVDSNGAASPNFPSFTPASGGFIDLGGVDFNLAGNLIVQASNGTIELGDVTAASIFAATNPAAVFRAGNVTATAGNIVVSADRIEFGGPSPEGSFHSGAVNATGNIALSALGGDGVIVATSLTAGGDVTLTADGFQGHVHIGDYTSGLLSPGAIAAGGNVQIDVTGSTYLTAARLDAGDITGQRVIINVTNDGGSSIGTLNAQINVGSVTATGTGSLDDVVLNATANPVFGNGNANVTATGLLSAADNAVIVSATGATNTGSAGVTLNDVNAGRVDVTATAVDNAGIAVGNVTATSTAPTPVALHLAAAISNSISGSAHIVAGNLTGSRVDLNVDGTTNADLTISGTVTAADQVMLNTTVDFGSSFARAINVSGGIALTDTVNGSLTVNGGNVQVSGLIDVNGSLAVATVNGNSITLGDVAMAGGSLYVQANAPTNGFVGVGNVSGRNITLQALGVAGANVTFSGVTATGNVTLAADAVGPSASAVVSAGAGAAVTAAGTVFLQADAGSTAGFGSISMFDVTAGTLDAQIIEPAPSGQIVFNTVTATNIDIDTHGGTLSVNGIVAVDSTAPVTVFLSADATPSIGGNITVGSGGIVAQGQAGGTAPTAANVQLVTAGNGNVSVFGAVSVTGDAGAYTVTTPFTQSGSAGYVNFNAQAGSNGTLLMTGGLDVTGAGIVTANLAGHTVNVSGPITITATPELLNLNRTFPASQCSFDIPGCESETIQRIANQRGAASLNVSGLMGASTAGVNLGDVTVTGPFATINVAGSNLNVGNLSADASGRMDLRVGSVTIGGVTRNYVDQDTLGQAAIRLDAGTGPGSQINTGDLSASGVGIAEIRVYANNISTGALDVAALASGFTHSGSTFGRFRREFAEFPGGGPVTLLEGTQNLGVATIEMGALVGPPSSASLVPANSIFVGGTVDVDGVGFATLRLRSENITISGDANVTATAGSQSGAGLDASSNPVTYAAVGGQAVVDLVGVNALTGTFDLANVTVDGPTSVITINNVGSVANTGNLTALGGTQTVDVGGTATVDQDAAEISISTGNGVGAGNLTAEQNIFVSGGAAGVVTLGDVTAPFISVLGDVISINSLTAISSTAPVLINATAFNNLSITGGVTAQGVQNTASPEDAVRVFLQLSNTFPSGGITVGGPISLTGVGANYGYSFTSGEGSQNVVDSGFAGTAVLVLSAQNGYISAGSVTIDAVGTADVSFIGGGGITLGAIDVDVAAASFNRTDTFNCFGSCSVTRTTNATATGRAFIEIQGDGGVVNVGAVNVAGPQVFVGITGKDVNVAGLALVGTGVTETVGSTGTASSGAETISFNVSRDGGAVQLNIEALPGSTSGHINITGALSATGIGHAVVSLAADHVVTQAVTLDAAAGSFTRSGARFTGGSSDLTAFFDPFGPAGPDSPLPGIDDGTVVGSRASLNVFGGFGSSCEGPCSSASVVSALNVTLGAVDVTAVGNASVRVDASGFVNVTGPVTITGGLAQVNGTGVETFFDTSVGSNVTLSRTVAASHGQGALYINGGASSIALGDVVVAGPVAEVEIEGGGNVSAGMITLTGTGGTIQVDENFDYAGTLGTDFNTQFIGPGLPTAVGVHAPGTVSLGQVTVDGVGIVGVFVDGGNVFVAGIDAGAVAGSYSLLDTRDSPSPTVATLGDVALSVFEGSCGPTSCTVTGPATIAGELNVIAARDVSLGVVADVTGSAVIQATGGRVSGDIDPLVDVIAQLRDDGPPEPTLLVPTDLSAAGLFILAAGDVQLDDAALFANPLAGAGLVSGDAAALAAFGLSPADPNLVVGAGGNVDLGVVEAASGSYVWLNVGGSLAPIAAGGGIGVGSVLQITRGGGFDVDQNAGGGFATAVDHLDPLGGSYVVLGGSTQTGDITFNTGGLDLGSRELAVITDGNVTGGAGAVAAAGITLDAGAGGVVDLVTSTGQLTVAGGATVSIDNGAFTSAVSLDIAAGGHDTINFATGGDAFVFGSFSGEGLAFDVAGGLTIDSAYTAAASISLSVGTYLATAGDTLTAGTLNLDGGASTDILLNTDADVINIGTADAVSIGNAGAVTVDFNGTGYGSVGIGATGALTVADGVTAGSAAFNGASLVVNGDVTTLGATTLTTGTTLTATGTLTAGALTVDGGTGTDLDLTTNAGTITLTEVDGAALIDNTAFTGSALLDISGATLDSLEAVFGGDASVFGGLTGTALDLAAAGGLVLSGNYDVTGTASLQTGSFFSLSGGLAAGTLALAGDASTDFVLATDVANLIVGTANTVSIDNVGALNATFGAGAYGDVALTAGGALAVTAGVDASSLLLDGASLTLGDGSYTIAGALTLVSGGAVTDGANADFAAGSITLDGAATTDWGLDVNTSAIMVLGGDTVQIDNLNTGTTTIAFSAPVGAVDMVFAGGFVLTSGLTATSLIVDAGQLAPGDAVLAGQAVTTTGFLAVSTLNGGDIDVTNATLNAGGELALQADGDVFDDGGSSAAPASLSQAALVGSLGGASVFVSGDNIRLGGTTVAIGAGTTDPLFGDALMFENLADAGFTVPTNTAPNGVFVSQGELALGAVNLTGGDYLVLQGNSLTLNGAITGPASLLVQIMTGTPGGSISVENTAGTTATLNLDVATLTQIADGTVVLGRGGAGSTIGNTGAIDLGVNGAIDLNGLDLMVVTTGTVNALGNVTGGGLVASLAELIAPVIPPEPEPILDDIDPNAANPDPGVDLEAGTGSGDDEDEEEDDGEDTEEGTVDEAQDDDSLIKQETAAPVGVCGVGTGG